MTRLLDGLRMAHSGAGLARLMGVNEIPVRYHPIVRTHPETARKALFLGPTRSATIEGMTKAESFPIPDFLYNSSTLPDNIYRHRWQNGDVVIWDNRCTMHYAVHDYGDSVRSLHRCTIEGVVPV
jgi:taurine dioxygenase